MKMYTGAQSAATAAAIFAVSAPVATSERVGAWVMSRHSIKSVNYVAEQTDLCVERNFTMPTSTPVHDSDKITDHGILYARHVGDVYWDLYKDLFGGDRTDCDTVHAHTVAWADTDIRDVESMNYFLEGLVPSCNTTGWTIAGEWQHVLMEEMPHGYANCNYATPQEAAALYQPSIDEWLETNFGSELQQLTEWLCPSGAFQSSGQGCPATGACTFGSMDEDWTGPTDGKCYDSNSVACTADDEACLKCGKWKTHKYGWNRAGHLAVTMVNQYLNNMTESTDDSAYVVGQNSISIETLGRLYDVADRNFGSYKNPINGRLFGQNTQAQLLLDLEHWKFNHDIDSNFKEFQYMMAHDVNYQWLKDALQVTTNVPQWMQGTSSIFMGGIVLELHHTTADGYTVQAWSQASSMDQTRNLSGMTRAQLALATCSNAFNCPLMEFQYRLGTFMDIGCIDPSMQAAVASFVTAEVDRVTGRDLSTQPPVNCSNEYTLSGAHATAMSAAATMIAVTALSM